MINKYTFLSATTLLWIAGLSVVSATDNMIETSTVSKNLDRSITVKKLNPVAQMFDGKDADEKSPLLDRVKAIKVSIDDTVTDSQPLSLLNSVLVKLNGGVFGQITKMLGDMLSGLAPSEGGGTIEEKMRYIVKNFFSPTKKLGDWISDCLSGLGSLTAQENMANTKRGIGTKNWRGQACLENALKSLSLELGDEQLSASEKLEKRMKEIDSSIIGTRSLEGDLLATRGLFTTTNAQAFSGNVTNPGTDVTHPPLFNGTTGIQQALLQLMGIANFPWLDKALVIPKGNYSSIADLLNHSYYKTVTY